MLAGHVFFSPLRTVTQRHVRRCDGVSRRTSDVFRRTGGVFRRTSGVSRLGDSSPKRVVSALPWRGDTEGVKSARRFIAWLAAFPEACYQAAIQASGAISRPDASCLSAHSVVAPWKSWTGLAMNYRIACHTGYLIDILT